MSKKAQTLGKADLRRYHSAMALFGSARQRTVTPAALNTALGEICAPSKTVWMLKKIGFKVRANKVGRDVISYTLVHAPHVKDANDRRPTAHKAEVSLSEFRAKWPSLLDDVGKGRIRRVVVVKRGKPFIAVTPASAHGEQRSIFGGLKGAVTIPPGVDLTKPVFEGEIDAELGILHR